MLPDTVFFFKYSFAQSARSAKVFPVPSKISDVSYERELRQTQFRNVDGHWCESNELSVTTLRLFNLPAEVSAGLNCETESHYLKRSFSIMK